ncbi:FxSxx-COOH cyclophane-containing RiPP peptide [Streptomyces griseorubiginosus]|uniref:FxSxx-COOH cyclophane-containing RiPP peptide n=1 Tax=Streptomyces griseorubiginosus TaxID=67304 RepID=UPI001AD69D0A|nr:FxSxx-COOH cyclophane-containing RiPP peptide [Streptomyces griseorubiginosus]MBO4258301.1 FXSXX-COOH protein [Streptomyces griseorubiginosus]
METPSSDLEFDDVLNLSGVTAVELDELPDNALVRAMRRVRRDVVERHAIDVAMFDSSI